MNKKPIVSDVKVEYLTPKQPDYLSFVDEDIRAIFDGNEGYFLSDILNAQLIKELRKLNSKGGAEMNEERQKNSVLADFNEIMEGITETPIDRLRFFCSLAMSKQDWLDVEPFFDDVQKELSAAYFRGMVAGSEMKSNVDSLIESPPGEPEEVYSPHAVIVDDKCRKCAGQMKNGKAIEQAFTGSPDFVGGSIVTMSNGGLGKMVDCMKCSDCGWSVGK